jgi:capsular polysaccharide export protein
MSHAKIGGAVPPVADRFRLDSPAIAANNALAAPLMEEPLPVRPIVDAQDRVLLLQGPVGPFFRQFADWLRPQVAAVWKINFNGGDWYYYHGKDAIDFLGSPQDWPEYLRDFLQKNQISRVFLFGDCRLYHRIAVEICRELGIPAMIFEEGYIRPDFVTLEEYGVNARSSLPRDPAFYQALPDLPEFRREPAHALFRRVAWQASVYYTAGLFLGWRYRRYRHHRNFNAVRKGLLWILSGIRKLLYNRKDQQLTHWLVTHHSKGYFLVPLQVRSDSQVRVHSDYPSIHAFIAEVIASFAGHAPADTLLVFKHHPIDRGFVHYGAWIRKLAQQHGIAERVIYAHELHLPTCLDHACGVVVINSTVGLSALLHHAPVKTLGRAIYDMEGLTCQRPLDEFWQNPGAVSEALHRKFRHYLIEKTQFNGNFHGRFPFP